MVEGLDKTSPLTLDSHIFSPDLASRDIIFPFSVAKKIDSNPYSKPEEISILKLFFQILSPLKSKANTSPCFVKTKILFSLNAKLTSPRGNSLKIFFDQLFSKKL